MGTNTKAINVTSSTLGFEHQGERPVVTIKQANPIRGETCLKHIPLLSHVVTIVVRVVALLQKHVILIKESNKKGSHLSKCQKEHPINLNKSFWTCFA
jgi:hypothetical protein